MKKILHWGVSAGDDQAQAVACVILLSITIFVSVQVFVSGGSQAGIDFSCFWGAGAMALDGHASSAYDWEQLHQQIILRMQPMNNVPYPYDQVPVPFFYPPVFFLVLAPLALLPFPIAFWVWSAAKLFCWLLVIYAIRPRSTALLLALAAPPIVYDFFAGQSGLLAASLLGGILLTLNRRPLLSGFLLALLIFKPQYGIMLPFVLVATGRWSVVITATLVVLALILITGITFGWDTFSAFSAAATFATTQFHLSGALPWYKLQSIYGLLRFAGFGYGLAMSFHLATASAAAIWVLIIWRRNVSFAAQAASLLAATPLISPYFAIYDLPILAMALVFLMNATVDQISPLSNRRTFRIGVSIIFVLGYAFPFVRVPVGPFMCATMIVIIWMRLRQFDSGIIIGEQPRKSATVQGY
jgi:alpha-1,2-mannosyltransferase